MDKEATYVPIQVWRQENPQMRTQKPVAKGLITLRKILTTEHNIGVNLYKGQQCVERERKPGQFRTCWRHRATNISQVKQINGLNEICRVREKGAASNRNIWLHQVYPSTVFNATMQFKSHKLRHICSTKLKSTKKKRIFISICNLIQLNLRLYK